MPFDIKTLVKSEEIYTFLEESFISTLATLKEDNLISDKIQYEIFRNQADFDGTLTVNMYAEDDELDRINYAIFRFLGGRVEPSGGLDAYLMSYSLETLDFEEYRDDIRMLLTTLSHSVNGNIFSIQDSLNTTVPMLVEIDAFPTTSETIDANGANKFMTSNIINVLLFPDIAHSDQVVIKLNGIQIPFTEINFTRSQVEPVVDLAKTYEVKFLPSKSSFSITINGYYKDENASAAIFDWLMDETKLAESFRLFYSDGRKIKTGTYIINESSLDLVDGQPITYNMSLVPFRNATQTYFGVLVIGADGTDEYLLGSEISLSNENANHDEWEIEAFTTDQTILNYVDSLDIGNPNLVFDMPACNLKITARNI